MIGNKSHDTKNRVYYNISIPHDDNLTVQGSPTPARFLEVRSEPLFNGPPNEWTMSVVRFSAPTSYIPLFICPIQGPGINDTIFSVSLSYLGVDYQTFLTYVPQCTNCPVPSVVSTQPVNIQFANYYSIYSIQHFVDMINTALNASYLALTTAVPALIGTLVTAPVFSYNTTTNLFSFIVPVGYATAPVSIFFNTSLYGLFDGSFNIVYNSFTAPNGTNCRFIVEDLQTNRITLPLSGPCYQMNAEFSSVAQMISATSLVFVSGTLPVNNEWLSSQNVNAVTQTQNSNNFLKIITDLELSYDTGREYRSFVHYLPTAEYRRLTLKGEQPISTIDIQVFWKDNYDNLFPLLIPAHDIVTMKILFERKN